MGEFLKKLLKFYLGVIIATCLLIGGYIFLTDQTICNSKVRRWEIMFPSRAIACFVVDSKTKAAASSTAEWLNQPVTSQTSKQVDRTEPQPDNSTNQNQNHSN